MNLNWQEKTFTIKPSAGDLTLLPKQRTWKIELHKVTAEEAVVLVNQTEQKDCCTHNGTTLTITLADIRPEDTIEIRLPKNTQVAANPVQQQIFDFLNQAEIDFIAKEKSTRQPDTHRKPRNSCSANSRAWKSLQTSAEPSRKLSART